MRLFLSSHRFGSHVDSLLSIIGGGRRAAVIENALDGIDPEARERHRRDVYDPVADFAAHGVAARQLDLRAYFGHPAALRASLAQVDLVWVTGGNVFVLRRAMRQSGFDNVIRDLLEADVVAYGGFSAGAVVAGPTLRGIELMDDPFELPDGYDEPLIWSGLGLTPFAIVPHYQSPHPEAASAEKVVSYMRARRTRYRAISDGEVIVQAGNLERLAS
jgi:dipeptidase E